MTNVLTDEEIHELQHLGGGISPRAIEAAVIKRLSAGVSVEPVALLRTKGEVRCIPDDAAYELDDGDYKLVTLDQLNTERAAARVQENERMAKIVKDAYMEGFFSKATYNDTQVNDENEEWEKSDSKRALLGKEAT